MATPVFVQTADFDLLIRMGVALAIGALIGLERERHRDRRTVLAGIRTYPLVALSGVVFAFLGTHLESPLYVVLGAFAFAGFSLMLYRVRHSLGIHGITSPVAFFTTYLVGSLIGLGFLLEGVIAGVAVAILLFTRQTLHRLAEVMTQEEMAGALQFIVIAFILFPLIADNPLDPWGIINPKWVLLIVIFVSGVSFASFLVMRTLGTNKGLPVSGLLGGLVNSEATTASLANLVTEKPHLMRQAVVGIALANSTMLIRNLLIAGFVDPSFRFLTLMAPPLVLMAVVQTAAAVMRHAQIKDEGEAIRVKNPFAVGPAVRFALLFVGFQIIIFGLTHIPRTGEASVLIAAVGGLVSSAAVVASTGTLAAGGQVSLKIAVATAVLATIVSTLNKLIVTKAIEGRLVPHLLRLALFPALLGIVTLVAVLVWM
ncbi:MAG: DUF4010 domain-containing protein [Euryarchaeota archaeon]|nr:DUF4010 domain-containing protein [Euryarchaeota archaeon]